MIMKRWIALALSVITLLTACAFSALAEESDAPDWSVYAMEENKNGVPIFKDPPAHSYTKRGLRVTPTKRMASYTVQLDAPVSLEEGLYLELELEDVTLENMLMIHLWNQNGVLIGNYNCGSGWYAMISVNEDGSDYMMSLNAEAVAGSSPGWTDILGSMKVNTEVKGRVGRYTLSVADGIVRLNGSAVPGLDEALEHLAKKTPDGKVYVGVSVMSFDEGVSTSAMVLTRFGKDEASATVPGTNAVPGTSPSETEPVGTAPDETIPDETDTGTSTEEDSSSESVTDETDGETESETLRDFSDPLGTQPVIPEDTRSYLEQFKDVYGQASAWCHSTVGLSGLGYAAAIALGALLLRKKKD
jgi:hypothetical protein